MSDNKHPEIDPETPPWLQPIDEDAVIDPGLSSGFKLKVGIGVAVIILAGAGAAAAYILGGDGAESTSRVIKHVTAPTNDYKIKPANPGGLKVAHQDKEVLEAAAGNKATSIEVAAPPEQPIGQIPTDVAQPVTDTPVSSKSAEDTASDGPKKAQPVPQEKPIDAVNSEKVKSADTAATASDGKAAEAAPEQQQGWRVQLGAFASDAAAKQAWGRVRAQLGSLVADMQPDYSPVDTGDRQLVRLRAGVMADRAAAAAFCLAAKDKKLGCYVVPPGR